MTFAVDKRLVEVLWITAPDVIPPLCRTVSEVPLEQWNEASDLYQLADSIEPHLQRNGAAKWDFIWSMERHFSEPYGPLARAKQHFMAGVPVQFLQDAGGLAKNSGKYSVGGRSEINFAHAQDIELLAAPFQFEAHDPMPDEYRLWLGKLFFKHGECMMPYFGEAADGHSSLFSVIDEKAMQMAPDADSRLRLQNFTAEEYKHTYQFYKLYQEYDPAIPVQIYENEKKTFRAYEQVTLELNWIDRAMLSHYADRFGVYQAFQWVQSSYAPLARVSLLVCKDERGHSNMGYLHIRDAIARGGPDARDYAQKRIDEYWFPQFMASFGADESHNNTQWRRWGLKALINSQVRDAYDFEIRQVNDSLGLKTMDRDQTIDRGLEMAKKLKASMIAKGA